MENQNTGAVVAQTTKLIINPFLKPEKIEGIIHRVGNPIQVKVDCSTKGGFEIEINTGKFEDELRGVVILGVKTFNQCSFFEKTYKGKVNNWVVIFAVVPYNGKKYFTQMLVKGESADRLSSCLLSIQTQEKALASVSFDLSFEGKSSKGNDYKVVKFKMNDTPENTLKEVYEFAERENAIENIEVLFTSTFLENIIQNAKILFGEPNPLYSETPESK